MADKDRYGFFGWEEVLQNREDLLTEFDKALGKNKNRPIRTSHGNAGEAVLRKFLGEFLPQRFGVTSGYIIPDMLVDDYKLLHYDVIIYDKLNSPILWGEDDFDTSELGRKRAIPAKYVFSVLEVKATITKRSINEAMKKLSELNNLKSYFPSEFSCGTFFFQIKQELVSKKEILREFSNYLPHNYWGGIVLRTEVNTEMTGFIEIESYQEDDKESTMSQDNNPFVYDVDKVEAYHGENNNTQIGPGFGGTFVAYNGVWNVIKSYATSYKLNTKLGIGISWSRNNFSHFINLILLRLEGRANSKDNKFFYGQILEKLKKNK